jgi:asparagine synthetase B (glutamine-hydrolysing)
MYLEYKRTEKIEFNKRIELKYSEKEDYLFEFKNKKIILGGKFYYYNLGNSTVLFKSSPQKQLLDLVKKNDLEVFINKTEGEFWGIEIDYKKKSLRVFSDKLKQLELYYFYNKNIFIASDNIKEIINKVGILGYDKNSLISSILLYVPKGQTLFKGIHRLRYNEIINVTDNKISTGLFKDNDVEISNYSDKDLERYEKIFKNSVFSRASNKLNLVLASGGWDSMILLTMLAQRFGKEKVRALTLKIVLSDGRCFNKFEIKKVKDACKVLGVKADILEINYRKEETRRKFEAATESIFLRDLLFLAPANWYSIVNHIKNKYGEDTVVFHGEGSDSLHNYGFSQFVSLPLHDNERFLEYADKMKNYLFSPSFFKKIKNNTFSNDTVYKLFRYFNQGKEYFEVNNLSENKKIYYYLLSFIFSDVRIPFRKVEAKRLIKDAAFRSFEKWIEKEYFQSAVENINENNFYYCLSKLYAEFHLQSPHPRIYRTGLKNMRYPYIDSNMFRFLYKMPQSFGRGLEFRPTKYPLKETAKKFLPEKIFNILDVGPHSYLSDVEEINLWNEIFLKGVLYKYFKEKIDFQKCKKVFDAGIFRTDEIGRFITEFKQGKIKNISFDESRFLLILLLLSLHAPE